MSKQANRPIRQEIMLALIYPAVLGTILYELFDTVAQMVKGQSPFNLIVCLKCCLLVIAIGFYVADYLYIVFSKRYYWWAFLCDIAFLLTLYVIVIAIDVDNPYNLPHNRIILLCAFIFLLVYLIWDGYEFLTLPVGQERAFYRSVVYWELPSLIVIGVFGIISLFWTNQLMISILTTTILSIVTIWFGFLVSRMRRFHWRSSDTAAL
jgi:hypothetical protein